MLSNVQRSYYPNLNVDWPVSTARADRRIDRGTNARLLSISAILLVKSSISMSLSGPAGRKGGLSPALSFRACVRFGLVLTIMTPVEAELSSPIIASELTVSGLGGRIKLAAGPSALVI